MTTITRGKPGHALAGAIVAGLLASGGAAAQGGVYAYPLQGQTPQQQQVDQTECHRWAVGQTGFDPASAPRPAPVAQSYGGSARGSDKGFLGVGGSQNLLGGEGNVLSDAVTGAGIGAIGGAIAGDAGAGAIIGAASSALFGGILRSSRQEEDARWRRDQQAQMQRDQSAAAARYDEQLAGYRSAYGACMSARNYRVN